MCTGRSDLRLCKKKRFCMGRTLSDRLSERELCVDRLAQGIQLQVYDPASDHYTQIHRLYVRFKG